MFLTTPRPVLAALLSATLAAGTLPALSVLSSTPAHAQLQGTLSGASFVEQAAQSGLFEIEAAKLALEKSQSAPIRAFATQMIKDHEAMGAALKAAVQEAKGDFTIPTAPDGKQQAIIDRLKAAQGDEFDALYAETQVKAHDETLGIFGGYGKDGDQSALRSFAEKQVPMLQSHLDKAKTLKG